jgi:hypothetical protein
MYNNPYGQGISSQVHGIERRYISHLNREMVDSFEGSGKTATASKCACMCTPCRCVYGEGSGMSGGSGYATATVRDMGYEPTIGAGGGKGSMTYKKQGCGQIAALPPPENVFELGNVGAGAGLGDITRMPFRDMDMEPKADRRAEEKVKRVVGGKKHAKKGMGTAELKADLGKFDFNRLKDYIGLAKPKDLKEFKSETGLRGKGFEELKADLRKFDANRIKDYVGLGRYGKKFMKGSGFFDSIANFFKQFPEKVNSVLMPVAKTITETVQKGRNAIGLGRGTAELKSDLAKFDMNRIKDYIGLGRVIPQKVVERSVMEPVIGGKKPKGADGRKKRAEIVKKVMRERGVKMIEASKIVKAEGLY